MFFLSVHSVFPVQHFINTNRTIKYVTIYFDKMNAKKKIWDPLY